MLRAENKKFSLEHQLYWMDKSTILENPPFGGVQTFTVPQSMEVWGSQRGSER